MKTNPEKMLRDPDIQPSSDVIAQALGETNGTYIKFVNELASHGIDLVWHYYNDGKAWLAKGLVKWTGVRGGQKETTAFWLSIWDGLFKLSIFIPEKAYAGLLSLPLDNKVKQMISDSLEMEKQKYLPLVFDMCSEEMFEAVFMLADFKKSIK